MAGKSLIHNRRHSEEDRNYSEYERNKAINPFPNYSEFGPMGDFKDEKGRLYKIAYYGDGFTPSIASKSLHQNVISPESESSITTSNGSIISNGRKSVIPVIDTTGRYRFYVKIPRSTSNTSWFNSYSDILTQSRSKMINLRRTSHGSKKGRIKVSETVYRFSVESATTGNKRNQHTGVITALFHDKINPYVKEQ